MTRKALLGPSFVVAAVVSTLAAGFALTVGCSSNDDDAKSSATNDGGNGSTGDGSTNPSDASTVDGGSDGATGTDAASDADAEGGPGGPFTLTSAAFANGATIPATHALCPNGSGNQSPPLAWSNAPAGTQSYAIVMRDPDVAAPNNYHWVIWDIPVATTSLAAGVQAVANPPTPAGAKQTYWSFGSTYSYQGPCPPNEHDYVFTIYSFATATIPVGAGETSPVAADAVIQANKTGSATLAGKYTQNP